MHAGRSCNAPMRNGRPPFAPSSPACLPGGEPSAIPAPQLSLPTSPANPPLDPGREPMITMAHSFTTTGPSTTAAHPLLQKAAGFLKRSWDAYWARRAKRATVLMLGALDDRCLHDIGLDRSEIHSVVYGTPQDRLHRFESRLP